MTFIIKKNPIRFNLIKPYLPLILTSLLFCACNEKPTNESEIVAEENIKENIEKHGKVQQINDEKNNDKKTKITSISNNVVESADGHYFIEWKTKPETLSVNQYFTIEFLVKEPMKSINYSVDLLVDAGMQEHNHGMHTKPIVKRLDKQHFLSEGMLFHMAGKWQIELEISRGIMKEKAMFEITL